MVGVLEYSKVLHMKTLDDSLGYTLVYLGFHVHIASTWFPLSLPFLLGLFSSTNLLFIYKY